MARLVLLALLEGHGAANVRLCNGILEHEGVANKCTMWDVSREHSLHEQLERCDNGGLMRAKSVMTLCVLMWFPKPNTPKGNSACLSGNSSAHVKCKSWRQAGKR